MSGNKGRIYGLDILRAYSIFTVVYAHGYDWISAYVAPVLYTLPATDGVTIFFILSGFLIGNIILRMVAERRTSFGDLLNFLRRRWLRTIPNYMLVLAILLGYGGLHATLPDSAPSYLLFLQNFAWPQPDFFPESWSLAVEEWFYLLFPLVLFASLLVANSGRAQVACLAIFIILPPLLRFYRVEMGARDLVDWTAQVKMQVLTRLDSIAVGVAVAWLLKRNPTLSSAWRRTLFAAGIVLFVFDKIAIYGANSAVYVHHFTLPIETFAAALLLPYLCTVTSGSGGVYRAVTFTSKVSYALYLVHLSLAAL